MIYFVSSASGAGEARRKAVVAALALHTVYPDAADASTDLRPLLSAAQRVVFMMPPNAATVFAAGLVAWDKGAALLWKGSPPSVEDPPPAGVPKEFWAMVRGGKGGKVRFRQMTDAEFLAEVPR